uniref:Putative secreted protein n=1 Tax=Ixodes ricinus TaxID=34613 RepID=A0A6B0U613_IXORI
MCTRFHFTKSQCLSMFAITYLMRTVLKAELCCIWGDARITNIVRKPRVLKATDVCYGLETILITNQTAEKFCKSVLPKY